MEKYEYKTYEGERALFKTNNADIRYCTFQNGESPLKESNNLKLYETSFKWKYPLWYCNNVNIKDCYMLDGARAGIWYTDNFEATNLVVKAPKSFRRCNNVSLKNVTFYDASETMWNCKNMRMENVKVNGTYFAMNSSDLVIDGIEVVGDYSFDNVKNMVIRNAKLLSKDAFWNTENVLVENSYIVGEYLAWNAKNITFKNCVIESLQGLCYIDGLKMENCTLVNTVLSFEYSKNINAEIVSSIDSVKNPISGVIKAKEIKVLIQNEPNRINIDAPKVEKLITDRYFE